MQSSRSPQQVLTHGCYWLLLYSALWLLLSGATGWVFGLVCAVAATGLSLWLKLPPPGLRLLYLPHFLLFFLTEILLGAWDVARRALHPKLPLNPAWVIYPLTCTDPRACLLLSAMVGLMPGTLSTHFDEKNLYLHVLDQEQNWHLPIAQMEAHLARLLGATPA